MSLQVEKLENNTAKLTIEVSAENFEKAIEAAYRKNKGKFNIPGFRKGKVPYAMVEKMYGAAMFYEEAVNAVIPEAYAEAAKESGLEIVARPEIDVIQVEKGKPLVFEAEVTTKPEIKLGKYKGVSVEAADVTVTDQDVDDEIDKVKEQNSRLVSAQDKAVEDGDQVIIDFEGFIEGKAFEGGKGEDYPLIIGSHSFIDNFEEQLIGKNIGDDVDVHVTFPEQYPAQELAGKPALFKVTVKEIKVREYPEIDDDFAQDVSEFDTLEEYKADIRKKLEEKKRKEAETQKENAVLDAIINDSKMELPQKMVDTQTDQMLEEFAQNFAMQGMTLDQGLQYTGTTMDQLKEQVRPRAVRRIQTNLVLEAIVAAENIEVTDEEIKAELENMAKQYQMKIDQLEQYLSDDDRKNIEKDIAAKKAVQWVVEQAK